MLSGIWSSFKSLLYSEEIKRIRQFIPLSEGQLGASISSSVVDGIMTVAQKDCPLTASFPCNDTNIMQQVRFSGAPGCGDLDAICGPQPTEYFDFFKAAAIAIIGAGCYLRWRANRVNNNFDAENETADIDTETIKKAPSKKNYSYSVNGDRYNPLKKKRKS